MIGWLPRHCNAAAAHREIEKGHTRGKLVLIVDEDLAATMEL